MGAGVAWAHEAGLMVEGRVSSDWEDHTDIVIEGEACSVLSTLTDMLNFREHIFALIYLFTQ